MGVLTQVAAALDASVLLETAGHQPDGWQSELLRSDSKRDLLLCCRQSGKSTVAAALAVHTAAYHPKSLILLLSPSLRQSGELFRKTTDCYHSAGKPVPIKTSAALRLELANGSRIISLPGTEETVRGYSGVALLIIDEAARVADELYYSVRPMLSVSGGRLVGLSTPWGRRGWFYNEWANSQHWAKTKITARECPRLTEETLEAEQAALGDAFFRQEYLCEFLDAGAEGFIHQDWLDNSASLDVEPRGETHIGLDVARSVKGDSTVFVTVQGQVVTDTETARQPDLMATCGRAISLIEETRARSIRIDDGGVGGGVTDRLLEVQGQSMRSTALHSCQIVPFAFGMKAFDGTRFADWRSEAWWHVGEQLRAGKMQIPRDPALFEQLSAPAMLNDSTGRLRLESKDSMRRRGIKSPDLADALILASYPSDWIFTCGVL